MFKNIHFSFHKSWFSVLFLICVFFCAGLVFRFYLIPLNTHLHIDNENFVASLNEAITRMYGPSNGISAASQNQYSGFEHFSVVLADFQTTSMNGNLVVYDATGRPIESKEQTTFGQVQIGTRMKGNYKDIKNVISKLLAAHKGLSLDAVSFRRARSADPLLDAEVRLTFYYKKDA